MNYIAYTARFLYRIKWWLILAPTVVALAVFFKMGAQPRNYKSMTTVYTGIVSGYDITTTEGTRQDWNIINNAMDNLINIILSQSTLKNVSMRLYAQGLTHLDPDNDNQYLTARTSRYLLNRTPKEVMDLVDRTSEEKTLENLRRFEEADHDNHVYGMFHWNPPYYSYQALSQIKVKRVTSSDMLEISYENDDPYIVYNTLVILNDEFVKQYRDLRFGETNNVIAYFESELARVGKNLRELEDSLRDYRPSISPPCRATTNCATRRSCSTSRAPRNCARRSKSNSKGCRPSTTMRSSSRSSIRSAVSTRAFRRPKLSSRRPPRAARRSPTVRA